MKSQYPTRFRTNWEPEESTANGVRDTAASTNVRRTIRIGVALALVAVVAFAAGVAVGPMLHQAVNATTVNEQSGPSLLLEPGILPTGSPTILPAAPVLTGALYDGGWAGGPGSSYQPLPKR